MSWQFIWSISHLSPVQVQTKLKAQQLNFYASLLCFCYSLCSLFPHLLPFFHLFFLSFSLSFIFLLSLYFLHFLSSISIYFQISLFPFTFWIYFLPFYFFSSFLLSSLIFLSFISPSTGFFPLYLCSFFLFSALPLFFLLPFSYKKLMAFTGPWLSEAPGYQRVLVVKGRWLQGLLAIRVLWLSRGSWWYLWYWCYSFTFLLFPPYKFPAGVWLGCADLFSVCRLITLVCI